MSGHTINVAVETSGLYTGQAGVARYIRGLMAGLTALGDPGLAISELAWRVPNLTYAQPQRAMKTLYREVVWANILAPIELRNRHADLLHATCGPLVDSRGLPSVATLHDLAILRYPARYRRGGRWFGARRLSLFHDVDRVICISNFTAGEAMQLLGLPAARIEVVYNGGGLDAVGSHPRGVSPDFEIPDSFFLFVGSLEPGKNLALLRQVYELADGSGQSLPPLVIVGARWLGVEGEGRPPAGWLYAGRLPDAVLSALYRRARALVFPSRYEGFGLPILEAMQLGCPVICSSVASLPEVGGEAPLYAEQTPGSYLAAMLAVLGDPVRREEMIASGRAQAARFSWARCAGETAAVYRAALGSA